MGQYSFTAYKLYLYEGKKGLPEAEVTIPNPQVLHMEWY